MPSAYSHHSTCKQIVRLHSAGALPLFGRTAGSLRQEPEPIIVAHHCASFKHTADFARSPAIGVGIRSCTNRERYGVASHTFMKRYACALGFVLPVSPRLSSHLVVRTPAAHLVGWMYAAAASLCSNCGTLLAAVAPPTARLILREGALLSPRVWLCESNG